MIAAPHAPDAVRVGPLDKPAVFYSPRERTWLLAEDFSAVVDGLPWFIAAGFAFDLSSIPRVLWPLLASHELGVLPPLCHDWLYRHGGAAPSVPAATYTRAQADKLFRAQMQAEGVSWLRRNAAYAAVRAFGGGSWRAA